MQTELQKKNFEIKQLRLELMLNEPNAKKNVKHILKDYLNNQQETLNKMQLENNKLKRLFIILIKFI